MTKGAPAISNAGHKSSILWQLLDRLLWALTNFGSIIAFILAWEIFARSGYLTQFLLPAPSVVFREIWDQMVGGYWFASAGETLYRAISGWLIAAGIGIPLGMLMARQPLVHWFFDPLVSVGFPAPKIAFLPIFILWFGLYDTSKIVMVAVSAIFPIIIATWAGTRTVDKMLLWSARSLGASEGNLLREIILPAALPQILTGLQIALPISLIVALVTEFLMGGNGIGGDMIRAQREANSPAVFAGIVSMEILGLVMIKALEAARRKLLRWHPETAAVATL